MKIKNKAVIERQRSKVLGKYPYKWIKAFYSNGSGYNSEPYNLDGDSVVDETLVKVKGSELQQFLDEQLEKKEEEVKTEIARQLSLTTYFAEKHVLDGDLIDWGSILRAFIEYELKKPEKLLKTQNKK